MKLTVSRRAMVDALTVAAGVTPQKTPKPELQCVHVTAEDGVTLVASNMEMSVRASLAADVQAAGSWLMPARQALALLRELEEDDIEIEAEDGRSTIRSGSGAFTLQAPMVDDYPSIDFPAHTPDVQLDSEDLSRLVERTVFAAAREETRYAINGVRLEVDGIDVTMIGTDGRRLSVATAESHIEASAPITATIPIPALQSVAKAVKASGDESVSIRITDDRAYFRVDGIDIACQLLESRFPEWRNIIPKSGDAVALVTPKLASAVRSVAIMSSGDIRMVSLKFGDDQLVVTSESSGVGRGSQTVDVPGAPEAAIAFNPDYLLDALKVADEDIGVTMLDDTAPAVFDLGQGFRYVLMPISGS